MPILPTRRSYLTLALLSAAFIIYGSLVPLSFSPLTYDETVAEIGAFLALETGRFSTSDFLTNAVLLIPFGFFLLGALTLDEQVTAGAVLAVLALGVCVAAAAELGQIFFADRTPSMMDVVAQCPGNIGGIIGWCVCGPVLTSWLRALHDERDGSRTATRVLGVLAAGIVVADLLPMDFTIRPAELVAKYRAGRVVMWPVLPSPFSSSSAVDWLFQAFQWVPFGVLGVIGWTRQRRPRSAAAGIFLGCVAAAGVEFLQLFVWSRSTESLDLLIKTGGVLLGALGASIICRTPARAETAGSESWRSVARLGLLGWVAFLALYYWAPFDFVIDPPFLKDRAIQMLTVPFASYQNVSLLLAVMNALTKGLLCVVLGFGLRAASWMPAPRGWTIAALTSAAGLLIAIELGQLLLPARYADLTDIIIGQLGVLLGWSLGKAILDRTDRPPRSPREDRPTRPARLVARDDRDIPWQHFRPRERSASKNV